MSRFLPHAALAAAAAGALSSASALVPSSPLPLQSGASTASPSTPRPALPTAGHLALVRAHPGLRELNALLHPGTFLVDATQALLAGALRRPPVYPGMVRDARGEVAQQILSADQEGNVGLAARARMNMALLDARDGRLEDALGALTRIAAEFPGERNPRLCAAALCHVLGLHEEGARWLSGAVRDPSRLDHKSPFVEIVLHATLGDAPRAVGGAEELVLVTMLGLVEMAMWSIFEHGDLRARLEVLAWIAFLRSVVARRLRKDAVTRTWRISWRTRPPQST